MREGRSSHGVGDFFLFVCVFLSLEVITQSYMHILYFVDFVVFVDFVFFFIFC